MHKVFIIYFEMSIYSQRLQKRLHGDDTATTNDGYGDGDSERASKYSRMGNHDDDNALEVRLTDRRLQQRAASDRNDERRSRDSHAQVDVDARTTTATANIAAAAAAAARAQAVPHGVHVCFVREFVWRAISSKQHKTMRSDQTARRN